LIERFVPRMEVRSVLEIEAAMLHDAGIRVVLTDLDNTLVRTFEKEAPDEVIRWVQSLQAAGIRVLILSNNSNHRVGAFARKYHLPYISRARKPMRVGFRHALRAFNCMPHETAMIGDQIMTDIFGGNRMNLFTIWVHPIEKATDGVLTKINRRMEAWVLRSIRSRELRASGVERKGGTRSDE
jgi:HAD superfamily phosphatase (TIGR01668 family)